MRPKQPPDATIEAWKLLDSDATAIHGPACSAIVAHDVGHAVRTQLIARTRHLQLFSSVEIAFGEQTVCVFARPSVTKTNNALEEGTGGSSSILPLCLIRLQPTTTG